MNLRKTGQNRSQCFLPCFWAAPLAETLAAAPGFDAGVTSDPELDGEGEGRSVHLWQLDILRLLTFAAVILVHSVAFTEDPANPFAAGVMMVLEFGREVFFALTGFVLVYSCLGRKKVRARSFWPKRFLSVGVPYLAWSVIYYAFTFVSGPHPPFAWSDLGLGLIEGTTEYHLYFLLVSMQLYLVFPLLVRFVRATAHRALLVLGVVGVLNAAWLGCLHWLIPSGWIGFFWTHGYELLPTYAIYVLAGCYAALHFDELLGLLRSHRRRLLIGALGGLVLSEVVYLVQTIWMAPRDAADPLQPVMLLCAASVAVLLLLVGDAWSLGARRGLGAIRRASEISFGVYLLHPVVLTLVCNAGLGNPVRTMPAPVATALAVVAVTLGALAACLIVRRTPLALPLIGRAWVRGTERVHQLPLPPRRAGTWTTPGTLVGVGAGPGEPARSLRASRTS